MPSSVGTRAASGALSRSRTPSRPSRSRSRPEDRRHYETAFEPNEADVASEGFAWEEQSLLLQKGPGPKREKNLNFWDALLKSLAQCGDCCQAVGAQEEVSFAQAQQALGLVQPLVIQPVRVSAATGPAKVTLDQEKIRPLTPRPRRPAAPREDTGENQTPATVDGGRSPPGGPALPDWLGDNSFDEGHAGLPGDAAGGPVLHAQATAKPRVNSFDEGHAGPPGAGDGGPVRRSTGEERRPRYIFSSQQFRLGEDVPLGRARADIRDFDPCAPPAARGGGEEGDGFRAAAGSSPIRC